MNDHKGYTLGVIITDLLLLVFIVYPIINWLVK
jgi:hypothetical protein